MSHFLQKLFSLQGKTALVTGASGGIGRALAIALAEAGAVVGINGVTAEKLESTRQGIIAVRGQGIVLQQDIQSVAGCRELVAQTREQLGRLDILVNCAGINRRKPLREVTEDDYDAIMRVNLKALFFLCQEAAVVMRAQGSGKIINVGSITSTDGLGGVAVYGATKAAVAQLTRTMALEWARDNIQVNCLAPGFILTPLTEAGLWGDEHRKRWLTERIPARRPGVPEDLVGATLLLAGNASAYMTGQTVNVDGGYLAGGSWLKDDE